ncbi:hypothetical protein ACMA1D_21520 [Streptomyces sp. 796.1]|uniref:hypothetical protein n=1 Tax=Streptomyces sp. 796.1 TaxID=3163029 RepID=UPI0039C9E082
MIALGWTPPPCHHPALLPAGRQWDAIRTSLPIATRAFPYLHGAETCASIIDRRAHTAVWLIPPGQATNAPWEWWQRLSPHVAAFPLAPEPTHIAYIGVPPAARRGGPGIHWRRPNGWTGRYVVADTELLARALAAAVTSVHGPDALARQCRVCRQTVPHTHAVTAIGTPNATDHRPRRLIAHRDCARGMTIEGQP